MQQKVWEDSNDLTAIRYLVRPYFAGIDTTLSGHNILVDMSHGFLNLGLLADRPVSGYAVKKHVSASLSTVTNVSYGTLCPTLHELLDEGYVRV